VNYIPPSGKLLHVLQDNEFSRLGGDEDVAVDVRVITATNRQIEKDLQNGNFRQDLYYRINVVSIHLPTLREKGRYSGAGRVFLEKVLCLFEKGCHDRMICCQWSSFLPLAGNVRELENIVKKVVVLENGSCLRSSVTVRDLGK
jgi:transcriptional regulator with GAF, ATPase, and Fis domain